VHQHLVEDVKEGDIEDLLVKVFGLAARDPMEYCRTIKAEMKVNLPALENFDLDLRNAYWLSSHTPSLCHNFAILFLRMPIVIFFSASCNLSGRCFSSSSTPLSFGIRYTISLDILLPW
jgi:hypothetical protein